MKNCRFKSKTNICCFLFTIRLRFFLFLWGLLMKCFSLGLKKTRKDGKTGERFFGNVFRVRNLKKIVDTCCGFLRSENHFEIISCESEVKNQENLITKIKKLRMIKINTRLHHIFFISKPIHSLQPQAIRHNRKIMKNLRYWHKCFLQSCSCWVLGRSKRDSLWTKCKGSRMWQAGDIWCGRVQRHPIQTLRRCTAALNTCRGFRAVRGRWSVPHFWLSASLRWRGLYTAAIAVIREQQT